MTTENPYYVLATVLAPLAGLLIVASGIFASLGSQISAIRFSALGDAIHSYEICVDNSTPYDKSWFCNANLRLIEVVNDDSDQVAAHTTYLSAFFGSMIFGFLSLITAAWGFHHSRKAPT